MCIIIKSAKIIIVFSLILLSTIFLYPQVKASAPLVYDIPNQIINEDENFEDIELNDYVSDDDTSDEFIQWTYSGNENLTVIINENNIATITYPTDWFGVEIITFTAEDNESLTNSNDATFRVNGLPVANAGGPYAGEILSGQNYVTIDFDASLSYDPEGFSLQYRWDFDGDGTNETSWSSSSTDDYDYYSPGLYSAILWVKDDLNILDSNATNVEITGPVIDILTPNGGEVFVRESTYQIRWAAYNVSGDVKIELYEDESYEATINSKTPNDGSYDWTISSYRSMSDFYKIKIYDYNNSNIYDFSDANFTITDPYISVTYPNGDETWYKGKEYTIRWNSVEAGSYVNIELLNRPSSSSSFSTYKTIASNIANTLSYSWTCPTSLSSYSDQYKIKVSSVSDSSISDISDDRFWIKDTPTLSLTTPNGGETWWKGDRYYIQWSRKNVDNVKIQLYIKEGTSDKLKDSITSSTSASSESYSWTIPNSLSNGYYKIRIQSTSSSQTNVYDVSSNYFYISVKPTITVSHPNIYDICYKNKEYTIRWSNTLDIGNYVTISLYQGSSYSKTIASNTSNDGQYKWNVSTSLSDYNYYHIRVYSKLYSDIYGESDSFTIEYEPIIQITSPKGGSKWLKGERYTINWYSQNIDGKVNIDLYKGQSFFKRIAEQVYNRDGNNDYECKIPNDLEPGSYELRISSSSLSSTFGVSQGSIKIEATFLQVWGIPLLVIGFVLFFLLLAGIIKHASSSAKKKMIADEKNEVISLINRAANKKPSKKGSKKESIKSSGKKDNQKQKETKDNEKSHLTWEDWYKKDSKEN